MILDKIEVSGIRLFSYHGCLEEESRIGSDYEVNLTVWVPLTQAAHTDRLADTVDYVLLNRIVAEEMAVRSKLIEEVCLRIIDRILNDINEVQKVKVKVSKISPPIEGDVERVSVEMKRKR